MKKSVLIGLAFFVIFSLSFTLFLYDEIFHITGRQIFSDNDFEQPAKAFRPTISAPQPTIGLSPSNCQINSITLSHSSIPIGGTVSIYVDGENCNGENILVDVYEKDWLNWIFGDYVTALNGTFINGRATIDWTLGQEYNSLFDEWFEGHRLELYFEIEQLRSNILFVDKQPLLAPPPYQPIGYGCTNAFYIDRDCDGYGQGAHSPRDVLPPFGQPDFVTPPGTDANDFDPTINTPATAAAAYGGLDSAQDFKDWIGDLTCLDVVGTQVPCYTQTLGNIYFLAPTGNDATGQVNNPSLPFRDSEFIDDLLQPGDVVIIRGGYNSIDMGQFGSHSEWPHYFKGLELDNIHGTQSQPILVIGAPGERAWYNGYWSSLSVVGSQYLIVDGLEFNGEGMFGEFKRSGLELSTTKNIIFRNLEFTHHPAEIFGLVGVYLENVTFDSLVIHDSEGGQRQPEHGMYLNNPNPGDVHRNVVVKDSLFYDRSRHGIQFRPPYENLIVTRNIFHSNALRGIEIKGGIKNSVISDNLFFNNGLMPFLVNREAIHEVAGDLDNLQFVHNTLWVGSNPNGIGDSCINDSPGCIVHTPAGDSAIGYVWDGTPITFTNMVASNNVIYLSGGSAFNTNWLPNLATAIIQKNFIYSTKVNPSNPSMDLAGMYSRCLTQPDDGTQDLIGQGDGWCVAPNNLLYAWSLNSLENSALRPFVKDNVLLSFSSLANLFTDVNINYNYEPGSFNFNPAGVNPATDNSLPVYNSIRDIRGNLRDANPDSGAYELLSGTPGPTLVSISPSSATQGNPSILTFNGFNFVNGAVLQNCPTPQTCSDISGATFINSQAISYEFVPSSQGTLSFRVRNPDGGLSGIRSITILPPPPSIPSGLQLDGFTFSQADISWTDNSNNEDGFYIERSLSSTNGFIQIGTVPTDITEYVDTTVSHSTTYYYRVRAFNNAGSSQYSNTINVDIPLAPLCSAQGGVLCSTNEFCSGTSLQHSDSGGGICCNTVCQGSIPGLVGHWQFDDTIAAGDPALDSSGNNYHATCLTGECPNYLPTGGVYGGAYDFAGIWTRVYPATNPLLALTTQGTVMTWVNKDNVNKWHGLITKGDYPTHSYALRINPSNKFVCHLNGQDYVVNSLTLNAGTYYHVACSWGSGTVKMYINGVEQLSTPLLSTPLANSERVYFGLKSLSSTSDPATWDWFDGKLDDSMIFNRALTIQEINAAMNNLGTSASSNFDFSIGSSGSGSVTQGNNVQSIVTATQISGSGSVTFSATNLPSGVSASFSPISCPPTSGAPCTTTMTLTAASNAQIVTNHPVTVSGTNGATVRSTTYSLTVSAGAPASPIISSVVTLGSNSLQINWGVVSGATSYTLQRRNLPSGAFATVSGGGSISGGSTQFIDNTVSSGASYEYQIQASNGAGSSSFSTPVSGTTTPVAPLISSVAALSSTSLRIIWNDVNGETGYRLQRRTLPSGTFANVVGASSLTTTQFDDTGLISSSSYEYRVYAFNAGGDSLASNSAQGTTNPGAFDFTVDSNPTSGNVVTGASSAGITVTATQVTGSGSVTFSATNLPSGVSASFSPTSCTPTSGNPCTSTLTFSATSGATLVNNQQIAITGTSGSTSRATNYGLTVTTNPLIEEIDPTYVFNDIGGVVDIIGQNFDVGATVTAGGIPAGPLATRLSSNLIRLTVIPGLPGIDLDIVVTNPLGLTSNAIPLRINYPFDYFYSLEGSVFTIDPNSNFNTVLKIETNPFMIQENIVLTSELPSGVTLNFLDPSTCVIDTLTLPYPSCSIDLNVVTQGLAPGDHVVKLKGVSSTTSKEKEISFTLTVNPPAQNNGGSGGSSGGGSSGGGSSGGIRNVLAVCEDKKDNDNDGLIDYPLDLGCSSKKDSSETDPTEVEQTDTTPSDNDGQTLGGQEKDIEIRVVFWTTLILLLGGIAFTIFTIFNLLKRNSFNKLY